MRKTEHQNYLRVCFSKIVEKIADFEICHSDLKSDKGNEKIEKSTTQVEMSFDSTAMFCNLIFDKLKETLNYLPISVRHLCKLIEQHVNDYVNINL